MSMLFTDAQLSKGTASRQDGISQEDEETYRAKTNEFVCKLTAKLDMTPQSLWSACTLTHRFFTYESFKRRDRLLVAAAAVFLGGKMAENARRLIDVVGQFYAIKNRTPNLPPEKSKVVQDLKEEVLAYERLMLHVFGFNLYVDLPDFPSALKKVQAVAYPQGESKPGGPREEEYKKIVAFTINTLNDMYMLTTLPLRCEVPLLTAMATYLAVRNVGLPEPSSTAAGAAAGGAAGGEGDEGGGSGKGTWREVLGLPEDAETFCLIKRTIDNWRQRSLHTALVHRMHLEVAQVLSQEKRESANDKMDVSAASPPPPPPPPPRPRP